MVCFAAYTCREYMERNFSLDSWRVEYTDGLGLIQGVVVVAQGLCMMGF